MAILDTLPEIEVTVRVKGENLVEYDNPEPRGNAPLAQKTVIKYIESNNDAEYEFVCTLLPGYKADSDALLVSAYVDGKYEQGLVVVTPYGGARKESVIDGKRITDAYGRSQLLKFRFEALEIVESGDKSKIERDIEKSKNMGELVVSVRRTMITEPPRPAKWGIDPAAAKQLELTEKSLKGKALTHGSSYSEATSAAPFYTQKNDPLDTEEMPAGKFVFRYRSKAALRSEMIIPREESPDPAAAAAPASSIPRPGHVNVDELSVEELRKLARAQLESSRSASARPEPRIKPERGIKRERVPDPAVTIDLEAPPKKFKKTSKERPIDFTFDSD